MTLPPVAQHLRIYRLWRTAALLCGVGAAEFGVLAFMQRSPWLALAAVPLVVAAAWAARRALRARRQLQ